MSCNIPRSTKYLTWKRFDYCWRKTYENSFCGKVEIPFRKEEKLTFRKNKNSSQTKAVLMCKNKRLLLLKGRSPRKIELYRT